MCSHHHVVSSVRDNPDKEESIEIYNSSEYQKTRDHYNGGGLMLHELCHIGEMRQRIIISDYTFSNRSRRYYVI
jgi:hypothetical protein